MKTITVEIELTPKPNSSLSPERAEELIRDIIGRGFVEYIDQNFYVTELHDIEVLSVEVQP